MWYQRATVHVRVRWLALVALATSAIAAHAEPANLVDAAAAIPGLKIDLRYATPDNLAHRSLYPPTARCLLLPSVVERLRRAAEKLRPLGMTLKMYDCYRPPSVQRTLWAIRPQRGYVANPATGSHHNRGAAVDLTLEHLDGRPVEMPTAYDEFSPRAHHSDQSCSAQAQRNRALLLRTMESVGMKKNRMEWWHYEAPDATRYPLVEVPLSLRASPAPECSPRTFFRCTTVV